MANDEGIRRKLITKRNIVKEELIRFKNILTSDYLSKASLQVILSKEETIVTNYRQYNELMVKLNDGEDRTPIDECYNTAISSMRTKIAESNMPPSTSNSPYSDGLSRSAGQNQHKSERKNHTQYSPNEPSSNEPMTESDLEEARISKLRDLQKTKEEIKEIEHLTIGQHDNDLYTTHRCDRLTTSDFGRICKRKETTLPHNLVNRILDKNNVLTNDDMTYGRRNKPVARNLFKEKMNKAVRESGLFIDEEFGFLGASPDGVIEEERSILQIKCFPSLDRNSQDMFCAAKEQKKFPLFVDDNGSLQISKNHDFYYQIQGRLRISNMKKCYFVGYISPTYDITVLEVERDEVFINDMLPKLESFYKKYILPEVVLRRVRSTVVAPTHDSLLDESLFGPKYFTYS